MFLCSKCGPKYGVDSFWQMFGPQSRGACEECGSVAVCVDVHHSRLVAQEPEKLEPRVGLMRFAR